MRGSTNGDTPKWMVYSGKSKKQLDYLGVPPFQETSIWGYNGIYNVFWVYFLWASGSCPRAGPTVHTDGNPASARSGGPLWKAEVMVAPKSEGHWEIPGRFFGLRMCKYKLEPIPFCICQNLNPSTLYVHWV